MFGYYPNNNHAVGLDLLVKFSDLFVHYGQEERFSFNPIFTRQGGQRLTIGNIYEMLDKANEGNELKNVWVCGPPPMNNMFQRLRRDILKKYSGCSVDIM